MLRRFALLAAFAPTVAEDRINPTSPGAPATPYTPAPQVGARPVRTGPPTEAVHHTNMDTMERMRPEDVKEAAIAFATFAYQAAMRETPIPRAPR